MPNLVPFWLMGFAPTRTMRGSTPFAPWICCWFPIVATFVKDQGDISIGIRLLAGFAKNWWAV
jgi:hypothetical protein